MSIISDAKEIAGIVHAMNNVELYSRIVALQGQIVELSQSHFEAQKLNELLNKKLSFKATLHFKKPFYVAEGDPVPYCAVCWQVNDLPVHLEGPYSSCENSVDFHCPHCNHIHSVDSEISLSRTSSFGKANDDLSGWL